METKRYPKYFLSRTIRRIADLFDYALNVCSLNEVDFLKAFINSDVAKGIEGGDVRYITGKTGLEFLLEIAKKEMNLDLNIASEPRYFRTVEYWVGYVLGYYQWYSTLSFKLILEKFSLSRLRHMYKTFHECDISRFCSALDSELKEDFEYSINQD